LFLPRPLITSPPPRSLQRRATLAQPSLVPSAAVSHLITGIIMSHMFLLTFFSALILLCLFSPVVRRSIMAGDDMLDAHEAGLALVAFREPYSRATSACLVNTYTGNPVRESGPPACMAKLIMLRHKVRKYMLLFLSVCSPLMFQRSRRVHANADPRPPYANHETLHSFNPLAHEHPGFALEETLETNTTKLLASSIV
jgi:hypothetical protein